MLLAVANLFPWVLDQILHCPLKDIPRQILPPPPFLEGMSIDLYLIATYQFSSVQSLSRV